MFLKHHELELEEVLVVLLAAGRAHSGVIHPLAPPTPPPRTLLPNLRLGGLGRGSGVLGGGFRGVGSGFGLLVGRLRGGLPARFRRRCFTALQGPPGLLGGSSVAGFVRLVLPEHGLGEVPLASLLPPAGRRLAAGLLGARGGGAQGQGPGVVGDGGMRLESSGEARDKTTLLNSCKDKWKGKCSQSEACRQA